MEARNIYSSQTTMLAARHMKIHAQEERPFIANLKSPVLLRIIVKWINLVVIFCNGEGVLRI